MEKYEKLYKGLEMCAGPECNPECPYHGETRGGKTCRAWLLNDALVALANDDAERVKLNQEITCIIQHRDEIAADRNVLREECKRLREALELAEDADRPVGPKESEKELAEMAEIVLEATRNAEYWRGQAEALKESLRFYFSVQPVEVRETVPLDLKAEPEPGAEGDV